MDKAIHAEMEDEFRRVHGIKHDVPLMDAMESVLKKIRNRLESLGFKVMPFLKLVWRILSISYRKAH